MVENRNDQQFEQSSFDQQQTLDNYQNQEGQNRETTSSESQMDSEELYNEDHLNALRVDGQNQGNQATQSDFPGSPMGREQFEKSGSNPSFAQQSSQKRDEYASPDDFDELEEDELEDDEMISRVDEEDDMDILDDDQNPQMNQQGI